MFASMAPRRAADFRSRLCRDRGQGVCCSPLLLFAAGLALGGICACRCCRCWATRWSTGRWNCWRRCCFCSAAWCWGRRSRPCSPRCFWIRSRHRIEARDYPQIAGAAGVLLGHLAGRAEAGGAGPGRQSGAAAVRYRPAGPGRDAQPGRQWLAAGAGIFRAGGAAPSGLPRRRTLRRQNSGTIWIGGVLIALASMVPLVNLVAPLFGTALMVHLFHRMQARTRT